MKGGRGKRGSCRMVFVFKKFTLSSAIMVAASKHKSDHSWLHAGATVPKYRSWLYMQMCTSFSNNINIQYAEVKITFLFRGLMSVTSTQVLYQKAPENQTWTQQSKTQTQQVNVAFQFGFLSSEKGLLKKKRVEGRKISHLSH